MKPNRQKKQKKLNEWEIKDWIGNNISSKEYKSNRNTDKQKRRFTYEQMERKYGNKRQEKPRYDSQQQRNPYREFPQQYPLNQYPQINQYPKINEHNDADFAIGQSTHPNYPPVYPPMNLPMNIPQPSSGNPIMDLMYSGKFTKQLNNIMIQGQQPTINEQNRQYSSQFQFPTLDPPKRSFSYSDGQSNPYTNPQPNPYSNPHKYTSSYEPCESNPYSSSSTYPSLNEPVKLSYQKQIFQPHANNFCEPLPPPQQQRFQPRFEFNRFESEFQSYPKPQPQPFVSNNTKPQKCSKIGSKLSVKPKEKQRKQKNKPQQPRQPQIKKEPLKFTNTNNQFFENTSELIKLQCVDACWNPVLYTFIFMCAFGLLVTSIDPYEKPCPANATCGAYVHCLKGFIYNRKSQTCQPDPQVSDRALQIAKQVVIKLKYQYGSNQCTSLQYGGVPKIPKITLDDIFKRYSMTSGESLILKDYVKKLFQNQMYQKQQKIGIQPSGHIYPGQKYYTFGCQVYRIYSQDTGFFFFSCIILSILTFILGREILRFILSKKSLKIYEFLKEKTKKHGEIELQRYDKDIQYKFGTEVTEQLINLIEKQREKENLIRSKRVGKQTSWTWIAKR